jgi:MOSC domain-containing protein YiiM
MEPNAEHPNLAGLEAGLAAIRQAPRDVGTVELVVARPAVDERRVLDAGRLDVDEGLLGDSWRARGNRHTPDGGPHPGTQVTLMSARAAALIAGTRDRWPLAGDQLYVDFDLSEPNVPAGTRLALGGAVVEVSPVPHTGCAKFRARFGADALHFVNSDEGRALHLRGINVRVVEAGPVRSGDEIRKL